MTKASDHFRLWFLVIKYIFCGFCVMADGVVTIGYWNIRGLAAPMRMMMMYANVQFNVAAYDLVVKSDGSADASSWFKVEKPKLKEINPLINLPYVVDGPIVISQSNVCFEYLGKKLGLWGGTILQGIRCSELLCEVMDLRNKVTQFAYGGSGIAETQVECKSLLTSLASSNGIFQKLELQLKLNGGQCPEGCFLVGNQATAPDFHLWEILDQCQSASKFFTLPSPFEAFPLLANFHLKFAQLPNNARYFNSPLAQLPQNNKFAVYGATPGGERFVAGQDYSWSDVNGIY